jgi:BirA family transcriptional regulator, biotin operon repressor / biotin---[acetyl-CoA-carboxylase] ligase
MDWSTIKLPFVRSAIHLPETTSTNDLAKSEAASVIASDLPRLYRADRQTRGRGRGSNTWWSDEGSLLFSVLIDPVSQGIEASAEPRVSLAAGLAVLETVQSWTGVSGLGIRWPNDVEFEGRKLAGILVERINIDSQPRMIIGIGVNVSTRFDAAPADVRALAISLAEFETDFKTYDARADVLCSLLLRLGHELDVLASRNSAMIDRINRFDLLAGQRVTIDQGTTRIEGIGFGFANDGSLLVEVDGRIRPVHGGRVLR